MGSKQDKATKSIALLVTLACMPLASAQESEPAPPTSEPPAGFQRQGFLVGVGLGQGWIIPHCDNCEAEPGLAIDFHIGSMISRRAAIMLDVSSVIHTFDDGSSIAHDAYMLASQVWPAFDPTGRAWFKGGIGYPVLRAQDGAGAALLEVEGGFSAMAAAGYEIYRRTSFVTDGQLRVVTAKYGDATIQNLSLTVGVNWY